MEAQVHEPLSRLETSLNPPPPAYTNSPTTSPPPPPPHTLHTPHDSLTSALHTLYTHQKNYARILHLRTEASRLEDSIKATIRTCVDLRREIGDIYPSILSHSDDDEEDGEGPDRRRDVNYHTLLSFASRIGKHNTAAAKEAEEESIRRITKARKENGGAITAAPNAEEHKTNGNTPTAQPSTAANGTTTAPTASQDLIPPNERDWLDAEAAMARARSGMAFPAAENLRKGMLGRLQWIREQSGGGGGGGEEAVEREVERMIAEAEGRPVIKREGEGLEIEQGRERESKPSVSGLVGDALSSRPPQGQGQEQVPRHAAERKESVVALYLDLYNEDEDEEED